jgi:hypothetical protein
VKPSERDINKALYVIRDHWGYVEGYQDFAQLFAKALAQERASLPESVIGFLKAARNDADNLGRHAYCNAVIAELKEWQQGNT